MAQAVVMAVAAGLILFLGWSYAQVGRAEKAYTPHNLTRVVKEDMPVDSVVRLHIKGNSDSESDRRAKEAVRDSIMERFGGTLLGFADAAQAERWLRGAVPDIQEATNACLAEKGLRYSATAAVRLDRFPDKTYRTTDGREVYLPAGEYTALVIDLGSAGGDNWWCLLYPPLCYLDLVQRVVVKPAALPPGGGAAAPQTSGTPSLVVDELNAEDVPVRVRSLLLDALRSGIARISHLLTAAPASAKMPNADALPPAGEDVTVQAGAEAPATEARATQAR